MMSFDRNDTCPANADYRANITIVKIRPKRPGIDSPRQIGSGNGMLNDPQRAFLRNVARTLQIIVCAMAMGVIMFMAVVTFEFSQNANVAKPATPVVTYAAIAVAVGAGAAWLILPGLIAGRLHRSLAGGRYPTSGLAANVPNAAELGDVAPLAAIYQTRTIISVALLEGAAFMAIVAFMLERQHVAIGIALLFLLLILSHFPTLSRLEAAIDHDATTVLQFRELQ